MFLIHQAIAYVQRARVPRHIVSSGNEIPPPEFVIALSLSCTGPASSNFAAKEA